MADDDTDLSGRSVADLLKQASDQTVTLVRQERQGGPAMTADNPGNGAGAGETRSPDQIRAEIEQTREQLGDTVEALAAKTDVKAQAKSRIAAAKETAQSKRDEYTAKARQAAPDSASADADQLAATVKDKPLPFALGAAFMIALAIGWLLRRPR